MKISTNSPMSLFTRDSSAVVGVNSFQLRTIDDGETFPGSANQHNSRSFRAPLDVGYRNTYHRSSRSTRHQ